MPLHLEFEADSILRKYAQRVNQRHTALALETCINDFLKLKERLHSLEIRLLLHCTDNNKIFDIKSAAIDAWDIIKIIHKIHKLFPLLSWTFNPEKQARIDSVTAMCELFENHPDLIQSYFAKPENAGQSVMGDFQWGFRGSLGDRVTPYLCVTGELYPGEESEVHVDFNHVESLDSIHRYDGYTGIFGFDFMYIKRSADTASGFSKTIINIDDLLDDMGSVIKQVESFYTSLFRSQLRANPEIYTGELNSPPVIIRTKLDN